MTTVSLFSGIGGIELGLSKHLSWPVSLFVEIESMAQTVLKHHHPSVEIHEDITTLKQLPEDTHLLTFGSPCTDFSFAKTNPQGLQGEKSSLVSHAMRLLENSNVQWVVFENVANILNLKKGEGIKYVTENLTSMGFKWAYRVLDARSFNLPQKRRRLVLVGTKTQNDLTWLFRDEYSSVRGKPLIQPRNWDHDDGERYLCGFYQSEGRFGSSFTVNGTPTLKSGMSCWGQTQFSLILPQPREDGVSVVKIHPEDCERIQGFPAGYTDVLPKDHQRMKKLGNAVSVPKFEWIAEGIAGKLQAVNNLCVVAKKENKPWPKAAFSDENGIVHGVTCSEFPHGYSDVDSFTFMKSLEKAIPTSAKAVRGFFDRTRKPKAKCNCPEWALQKLRDHITLMESTSSGNQQ